jgi:hypothetical protein
LFHPEATYKISLQGVSLATSNPNSSFVFALSAFSFDACSELPRRTSFECSPSGLCSGYQSVCTSKAINLAHPSIPS